MRPGSPSTGLSSVAGIQRREGRNPRPASLSRIIARYDCRTSSTRARVHVVPGQLLSACVAELPLRALQPSVVPGACLALTAASTVERGSSTEVLLEA